VRFCLDRVAAAAQRTNLFDFKRSRGSGLELCQPRAWVGGNANLDETVVAADDVNKAALQLPSGRRPVQQFVGPETDAANAKDAGAGEPETHINRPMRCSMLAPPPPRSLVMLIVALTLIIYPWSPPQSSPRSSSISASVPLLEPLRILRIQLTCSTSASTTVPAFRGLGDLFG
jgi:hypothetical protein